MRKLIANVNVSDGYGNKKLLKVFTDQEEGIVEYNLVGVNGGIGFSLSSMQCGWRGPSLPNNIYEYTDNKTLLNAVIEAVKGGVYRVTDKKLFVE